jgi:hypothetical protein
VPVKWPCCRQAPSQSPQILVNFGKGSWCRGGDADGYGLTKFYEPKQHLPSFDAGR